MAMKTQGTRLYAIDPEGNSVIQVGCVTSLDGISAGRDQRETTCLEDEARSYEGGMVTPGAASVGILFDAQDGSHVRLHELYVAGENIQWAIGLSDGTTAPTADSNGDFDVPTDRTWIVYEGYISDYPFSFAISANVETTLAIQVSGFPQVIPKAA